MQLNQLGREQPSQKRVAGEQAVDPWPNTVEVHLTQTDGDHPLRDKWLR